MYKEICIFFYFSWRKSLGSAACLIYNLIIADVIIGRALLVRANYIKDGDNIVK